MTNIQYIDDLFVEVYEHLTSDWSFDFGTDDQAANNFYSLLKQSTPVTENQSRYIIKILRKQLPNLTAQGKDYSHLLTDPKWRHPFRVLDQTKHVWVEKTEDGTIRIVLKMPYALKGELDQIINSSNLGWGGQGWDRERAVRFLKLYDFNIVAVNEFVSKHKFQIDDSFSSILGQIEEIWQQQEDVIPTAIESDGQVVLKNSPPDAEQWWKEAKTGDYYRDIFLAKGAGYRFSTEKLGLSTLEKICSSEHTQFWIKTNERFFDLYKKIGGPIAVLVSHNSSSDNFVKKLVLDAEKNGVNKSDIRICYRLSKEEDKGFNHWIKENGLGGKVDTGKIFIFQNKPPKWLFSQQIPVKIILTNSCYPLPSATTQSWMNSHPCVCYIGDINISSVKEKTIVDL